MVIIYHNQKCSKSRECVGVLEAEGVEFTVVNYLETPPSVEELKSIVKKLGLPARELLRKREPEYKSLNLASDKFTEDEIIEIMHKHPKLIERPVVVTDTKAAIGRPMENVLAIL